MKVSDIIIYIMEIMWSSVKRNPSSRFRDIQKRAKSKNLEFKVALRRVMRKQVSFEDRKKENTPKFPSIKILC